MKTKKIISLILVAILILTNSSSVTFAKDSISFATNSSESTCPYSSTGEHDWEYWDTEKESCTKNWKEVYFCTSCYEEKEVAVTPTGHDFSSWSVDYSATCGEDGQKSRYCWECYLTEYESIPLTGKHDWEYWDTEKETCTKNWKKVYYCAVCDERKELSTTPTGHDFGSWYISNNADCEYNGTKTRECSECYYAENKKIPATGHNYGSWYYESEWCKPTCEDVGYMTRDCEKCGGWDEKVVPATGHTYKTKTTKAKLGTNGKITKKCTTCYDVKSSTTIYRPKKIKLSKTSYTYNGKTKKPTVKVYNSKGKLIDSSNYTVSYAKGRKNVGKYKVTIKFKTSSKKYKGTFSTSFKIRPKATSVSSLQKGKKSFTVKWKKKTKQVSGYQIRYSTSSNMSNAKTKLVKSNKTTSKKITGLKSNKKYYVQVRTYKMVDGTRYYSSWSKKKAVTTKKSSNGSSSSSSGTEDNYASGGPTVYITDTGSKYHYDQWCRGLNNANHIYATSLYSAQADGYTLCGWED